MSAPAEMSAAREGGASTFRRCFSRHRRHARCDGVTQAIGMLRITTSKGERATLTLEGRLAGPWVDELARAWNALAAGRAAATITVRLDAVSFIDAAGKALCRRIHAAGAVLEASGCMMRAIVDEIAAGGGD